MIEPPASLDGTPQFSAANLYVYDEYVLLKSWMALRHREQIRTPHDTEELIESVYDESPSGWGEGALRERLACSFSQTMKERTDEESEARNRFIPRPTADDLTCFTRNPLEEDSPELHSRLQAMTRNTEPQVTCVCLFQNERGTFFDKDCTKPADLKKRADFEQAPRFIMRSLAISNKRLVYSLLAIDIPTGWRKNTLLRHMRPIFVNESHSGRIGEHSFVCDPVLGFLLRGDGEQEF